MAGGGPAQGFMYGAWNPSTRTWSGRWSHEKNFAQGPLREFSFTPKADTSVLPKNPCEQCLSYINSQDKYYGCSMCDKWGIHTKCFSNQLPYTCSSCLEWIQRYGSIPPLARTWIGYSDQDLEKNGIVSRYDDAIRMEFQYKGESSGTPAMLAIISGRGENIVGHYSVKGYISKSKSGEGYEMKIVRQYESSSSASAGGGSSSSQQQQQQPLSVASSSSYPSQMPPAPSGSRAPRRKAEEGAYDDAMDKRMRMNGGNNNNSNNSGSSSSSSAYVPPKRTATLVTSVGVEGNISCLVDVWRSVAKINDPSIGIVCLSAPATTLPLKALLRLYNSSDQLSQILRSSSAMAACSSACTAVDVAIETGCAAMSCASLDRKSQYAFPCAVAAAYAVDKYGKSVVAVDLCPKPTYLLNALQNTPRVSILAPPREPNGTRSWREAVNSVVSSVRQSMPDILMLSTVLGEFDAMEYLYCMDSFAALRIPFVVVVEDVTSSRATQCAQAMMEALARQYSGEGSSMSSVPQQQQQQQVSSSSSSGPPPPSSSSSSSSAPYSLPGGPTNTMYKSAGAPLGMYQSLALSASQQANKPSGAGSNPGASSSGGTGKPPSMGDKAKNPPPGANAYGSGGGNASKLPPPPGSGGGGVGGGNVNNNNNNNSMPGKPNLGISVTPPMRSGMPPQQPVHPSASSGGGGGGNKPGQGGGGGPQMHPGGGNKNGVMPPMPPYPGRSTSNGSAPGMYASPATLPKQLSGRQNSPLQRSSVAPSAAASSSYPDPFFDELSGDALEPLPFHPIDDMPGGGGGGGGAGNNGMPSGGGNGNNNNNGNNGGNGMPPPLSLPQAPSLDRQDSWDLGAESPRPHSKQFDYITASFKS